MVPCAMAVTNAATEHTATRLLHLLHPDPTAMWCYVLLSCSFAAQVCAAVLEHSPQWWSLQRTSLLTGTWRHGSAAAPAHSVCARKGENMAVGRVSQVAGLQLMLYTRRLRKLAA